MKRSTFILLLLLLPFLLPAANRVDSVLNELDKTIGKAESFRAIKENRLRKMTDSLHHASNEMATYQICSHIFDQYSSYKYDSAYVYAKRMLDIALQLNNPDLICHSKIAIAFSNMSAGLYKEATEVTNSIDTTKINAASKIDLYSFLSSLNFNLADFSGVEPYYSHYMAQSLKYAEKYYPLLHDQQTKLMDETRIFQLKKAYREALETAHKSIANIPLDEHSYAMTAATIGYLSLIEKDTTSAIYYFASAAISDIRLSTKETDAIRQLAGVLFEKGDLQRAFAYARKALDDANFYNARMRKIEVGSILPIIETERFGLIKQQKDRLIFYLVIISILLVLFFISTIIIRQQKKRLTSARSIILKQNEDLQESNQQLQESQEEISRQNENLKKTNVRLNEAHHIKDEYIGYFFSNNSGYVAKMEDFRKLVTRKIKAQQFDELLETVSLDKTKKEREELFAQFDQIFISIFPGFVDQYNELFDEEGRVSIKPDGTLAPEIRIFALVRLGITESERIARFLDFSLSTVKNYKTKARNRSIVPNELFDQRIMEIEAGA